MIRQKQLRAYIVGSSFIFTSEQPSGVDEWIAFCLRACLVKSATDFALTLTPNHLPFT
jgi:hypothetical protein